MEQEITSINDYHRPAILRDGGHRPFRSLFCPLEWDSGADVGYLFDSALHNSDCKHGGKNKLSTIERMALVRGCSVALENTTTTTSTEESILSKSSSTSYRSTQKSSNRPDANSTPLVGCVSGSESEIEITPIAKNQQPSTDNDSPPEIKMTKDVVDTPKASNQFEMPQALRMQKEDSEDLAPLKKSTSMNLNIPVTSRLLLRRSQSDLNLCAKDKVPLHLLFHSTSSIATTVVNKPSTCDKFIQTTLRECSQESVGIQASESSKEEEKPPLPKRGTSLNHPTSNNQNYKVWAGKSNLGAKNETEQSSLKTTPSSSLTPQPDDLEDDTGRANSFEYFPGHVYENVPVESTSVVSSIDTRASNSTMPNTSSSIEEKLWGNSDNLVKDLERSVNILKSLIHENKLDKQVKKRLIHHVVKRLITAKYSDEKIEHNLEENVPWNPDDARNKVYRTEIIQALAKNTTDSSDDWKAQKKKTPKKSTNIESKNTKKLHSESSLSDKFDRTTDRTEMDGRKARMGLRVDECEHRSSSNTPVNKSESSDCFLPPMVYKKDQLKHMYVSSSTNTSTHLQKRSVQCGLDDESSSSRQSTINSTDWRVPTTLSERRYELKRCSNSDSAESKLVNYAEMEKENQLIWITNEISHLLNLKKLLEQSKKPAERQRAKTYSRKITQNPILREQRGDVVNDGLNRQWSSHRNLPNCRTSDVKIKQKLRQKNSSTQTATLNSVSFSRTENEVISTASLSQKSNLKPVNALVQTQQQNSIDASCPLHQSSAYTNRFDFESSNSSAGLYYDTEDNVKQKDAKNHLNAMKTYCKCKRQKRDPSENSLHSRKICPKICMCDDLKTLISGYDKLQINGQESVKCTCDIGEKPHGYFCNRRSEKSRSNKEYDAKLCCHAEGDKKTENYSSPKRMSMRNSTNISFSEQKWRSCRICGKGYENEKNCQCIKKYPKPVAYELSIVTKDKQEKRNSFEKKSRSDQNNYSCEHDHQHKCEKKLSLQDYLEMNRPEFSNNVESRRQYLNEISRYRQLRQEKKMQLLAQASSSNTNFKAPRPVKKTKALSRQISDEEMKARIKKRYSQLSEVRARRRQLQKQQETRSNLLMAKIYCKKLQQKTLKGQVDLSNSVSVISNL